MKKLLFFLFAAAIIASSSCKKDSTAPAYDIAKQAATDSIAIKTYLTAHPEIAPVKDTLGIYYQVVTEGTGVYPTLTSTITVSYTGTLLNGSQFDASTNYTQTLRYLILGWQAVLPHVKTGSKVIMLVPSRYAYGPYDNNGIPANSVLKFTIELKSVAG